MKVIYLDKTVDYIRKKTGEMPVIFDVKNISKTIQKQGYALLIYNA